MISLLDAGRLCSTLASTMIANVPLSGIAVFQNPEFPFVYGKSNIAQMLAWGYALYGALQFLTASMSLNNRAILLAQQWTRGAGNGEWRSLELVS